MKQTSAWALPVGAVSVFFSFYLAHATVNTISALIAISITGQEIFFLIMLLLYLFLGLALIVLGVIHLPKRKLSHLTPGHHKAAHWHHGD